jgi:hypothetical protein
VLETKVVVQVTGEVLLHAEEPLRPLGRDDPFRFRRFLEIAFAFVFFESH